jgi:class 3 adenylate cyclase
VERRLTAVLAADVAGYSRLMGRDEEGTLAKLKSFRKALVDPAIAEHRGDSVKTTGDGMLAEAAPQVERISIEAENLVGDARHRFASGGTLPCAAKRISALFQTFCTRLSQQAVAAVLESGRCLTSFAAVSTAAQGPLPFHPAAPYETDHLGANSAQVSRRFVQHGGAKRDLMIEVHGISRGDMDMFERSVARAS